MKRLHSSAGIAIGPILFVIALLGILATVMASSNSGSFGAAGAADRVTSDIVGQTNLIRGKIQECYMQYEVNGLNPAATCTDKYPCSDPTNGTLVSALTCPNDPVDGSNNERSLWTGLRVASIPPATQGFSDWKYMNGGDTGGRCIWTAPTAGSANTGAVQGLGRAKDKFTTQEVSYSAGSGTQKFVVFITPPTGATTANCTVP